MKAPTENYISQTQHGIYEAVDYSAYKDKAKTIYNPDYYAPEDGKVTALGNSGACGLRLELSGATGRHGFCHNEVVYVKLGDQVKKGQKLAKMGYTGTTVPSGPAGRHLHWVISKNGTYVYPPSLINEPFKEDDVITNDPSSRDALRIGHSEAGGWNFGKTHAGEYDQLFMSAWQGKPWPEFLYAQWVAGAPWRDYRTKAIAFYEQWKDKIPQLTNEDDEQQIKEALASLAEAEAKAKAAQAKLNEALND